MALLTFVEPQAGIGGHRLGLHQAALGTGQRGFELNVAHQGASWAQIHYGTPGDSNPLVSRHKTPTL